MKIMNKLDIDRIAFIGRTYGEYINIFDLDENILSQGPVLDCAAGPSSFTAEAHQRGYDVSACDILYNLAPSELLKKGTGDIEYVFRKFNNASHLFTWMFYKDKEHVMSLRKEALRQFIGDYQQSRKNGRYKKADLMRLPYPDNKFNIVLSSHFLFLYGDRQGLDFHILCLEEMIRVSSGEIRIFPLVGLDGQPFIYLDEILSFLQSARTRPEIVKVPFEFQTGGNSMLKITFNN